MALSTLEPFDLYKELLFERIHMFIVVFLKQDILGSYLPKVAMSQVHKQRPFR